LIFIPVCPYIWLVGTIHKTASPKSPVDPSQTVFDSMAIKICLPTNAVYHLENKVKIFPKEWHIKFNGICEL